MRRQNVDLQDHRQSHVRWICLAEAERLEAAGKAVRVTRRKDAKVIYRLKWYPKPSNSATSTPTIRPRDMMAHAGICGPFGEEEADPGAVAAARAKVEGWRELTGGVDHRPVHIFANIVTLNRQLSPVQRDLV